MFGGGVGRVNSRAHVRVLVSGASDEPGGGSERDDLPAGRRAVPRRLLQAPHVRPDARVRKRGVVLGVVIGIVLVVCGGIESNATG